MHDRLAPFSRIGDPTKWNYPQQLSPPPASFSPVESPPRHDDPYEKQKRLEARRIWRAHNTEKTKVEDAIARKKAVLNAKLRGYAQQGSSSAAESYKDFNAEFYRSADEEDARYRGPPR
jgi:hypothetical protein